MKNEDVDFLLLQKQIFRVRGFDFQYNLRFLKRRFAVRMRAIGVNSYKEYAKFLEKYPNEYNVLFNALTINVTQFFRDLSVYKAFENQILPAIISAKQQANRNRIRIWSAGCASGEEPYSVAILLIETLKEKIKNFIVSIWATDIDNASLNKAKKGIYSLKNIGEINNYLTEKKGEKKSLKGFTYNNEKYVVNKEVKQIIRFNRHNFISEEPYTNFDVIFCRNVLIYLTPQMRNKLLEIFYNCLNKNGYLIIGRSEALLGKEKLFCPVNIDERIFCKAPVS